MNGDVHRVFRSRSHPGDLPWRAVYAGMLVRTVAACMLPVVIGTLVAVLQGYAVQPYVWWASAAALGLASGAAAFHLQRKPAELHVDGPWAVVLSIWECAHRSPTPAWQPVIDVRDYGRWIFVTIGHSSFELEAAEWPDYDALRQVLRQAHRHDEPV